MTSPHTPRVGISATQINESIIAACVQLKNNGVIPVMLEHDPTKIDDQLKELDAVVIMGNPYDILPEHYQAERDKETLIPQEKHVEYDAYMRRMEYEKHLAPAVIAAKLPLLGVCGGMQRINISPDLERPDLRPGTLDQHVEEAMPGAQHFNPFWIRRDADTAPFTPVHFIKILEDSRLSEISKGKTGFFTPTERELPEGIYAENSIHHQRVGNIHDKNFRLRDGFIASAIAPDGTVEAMEPDPKGPYAGQDITAVQFHPEFSASSLGPKIMATLAEQAKRHARTTPRAEKLDDPSIAANAIRRFFRHNKADKDAISALFDPSYEGRMQPVTVGADMHR